MALLGGGEIFHRGDVGAVHLGDDIAHLQPGLFTGTALVHAVNEGTAGLVDLVLGGHLLGHGAGGDAEGGLIGNLTIFHNVRDDGLHVTDGNGKAQTLHGGVGIAGILGGYNAHHLAVQVH